jgi:hypothetical protein
MEPKEIEDARTQMVFVRGIKDSVNSDIKRVGGGNIWAKKTFGISDDDWKKYTRISAQYNFKKKDCVAPKYKEQGLEASYLKCITELEKIIAKKINKAESLDRPALLAKKNETEKLLASHRNNLVALECDAPKKDDGSFDSKLSGYWELELGSPYGGTTQLTVANGGVSGSSQRSATAVIKITGGSFDPATKRLSFTYIQQWSQRTGKASFEFRESSTNYILTGIWRDDVSGSGNWVMTKKKQKYLKHNFLIICI